MFPSLDRHETYNRQWCYKMIVAHTISSQKVKDQCHRVIRFFYCVRSVTPCLFDRPVYTWHKYSPCRGNVSCSIFESKGQRSRSHRSYEMKVTPVIRSFCRVRSMAASLFGWITSYVAHIQHTRGRRVMLHFQGERSKVMVIQVVRNFYHVCSVAPSLFHHTFHMRSAPETQLCKVWLKTWKRFYSDGKCPLDGTWCQRNNCQSSYKGEITPEETDR